MFLHDVLTLDMMMDDLKLACDASKNRAPPARVQTMAFLTRAVEKRSVDLSDKTVVTFLASMFHTGLEDTDPKVREAGQSAMVALLKVSSATLKWLQPMLDEMASKNPRAFKAIQRGVGDTGALTLCSAPPSRPSSVNSATSRSSIGQTKAVEPDVVDVEMADAAAASSTRRPSLKKKPGPPARVGLKPPAAGRANAKAVAMKPATAASGGASSEFTPVAISLTTEEAETILVELELEHWNAIEQDFASSKWMERKGAIEKLEEFAKSHASALSARVIEALTLYLGKHVKDFKDSNINVLKSAFEAVGTFAATATGPFPRSVVCRVVPRACDKIGDKKANKAVHDLILSLCEATSPSYTMGCLMASMPNVRLPLAHLEALVVLLDSVQDFGVAMCHPRALMEYAKGPQGLDSSNPKVRSAAIALLSGMYSQLGPALLPILNLESWKPALAETVKAAFDKAGYDPAKAQTSVKRRVKDQEDATPSRDDPAALFGRVDVGSHVTKELLDKLKNESDKGAWKQRSEALDTIQAICERAGCAIAFTRPVQDVVRLLNARLSDANANLKVKAANVLATVVTSVGPEIAKMSKLLGPSLIAGVADNKKTMQAAALHALHQWVRHSGKTSTPCVESLLVPLSEGLWNAVGRAELLTWAVEHVRQCEKLDLQCLVGPTVHSLMDKSSDTREKAQQLLVEVMKSVGKETVMTTGCRDMKPAAMRALKPLLSKVCEAVEATEARRPSGGSSATSPHVVPLTAGHGETGTSGIRKRAASAAAGTPVKSRLVRPGSLKSTLTSTSLTEKEVAPLLKLSTTKAARLSRGQSNRWIFETTSPSEMSMRKSELEAEWKPWLRFRVRFRAVMKLVVDVFALEKYVPYLIECFNSSKNMKSRCECIDLVEWMVSGQGYHVVGRKCIKEVAKYVVAHEKELRESAINTLVAVYLRTDGEHVDKFFRFVGITTQQGMDLVNARLKHLPASNVATAEESGSSVSQRSRQGFGFGRASTSASATPTKTATEQQVESVQGDDDIDMSSPPDEVEKETSCPGQAIEDLLLRPIAELVEASSKEVVAAGSQAYKEGGNALKGLYSILTRPSEPSEVAFLHSYVNEIVLALCECIHGAFYAGNVEKRPEMYILAMSLTTLTVVFNSDAVTSMQRYTVERVLLELCSKLMDPRLEKVAQQANVPVSELHLTPDENRYLMVYKALYKALRKLTERAKPGDVYPSVINLLQRLVHNDVGEYNRNDALKHLLKEDSLDQLVGRILLKLSTVQATLLTPFEGINVFGVLMQLHGFFSTLPRAEVMMVDLANETMRSALGILASSLRKTRPGVLEAALKDIPSTSIVRKLVEEERKEGKEVGESTGAQADAPRTMAPRPVNPLERGNVAPSPTHPRDSLARRLFPLKDSASTVSALPGKTAPRGRSFTSFHDFTAHRGAALSGSRPSTTSAQLESLRERLQQSRHFK
ncbi:hypothetical protein PsorP6_002998 [Peronosclerospora sorghi]|uniref:Uncharacterized protein n=1 Tax=Peronosclerospora sorghi TaxID=230839 RepID=A0ACC0VQY7_9STRA|nr:hypothetical protein PsorP6_002998 [Peronosclerospora sorghi]